MLDSIGFRPFFSFTFTPITKQALVDTAILIETLFTQVNDLTATVARQLEEIDSLKLELAVYTNKKNSGNSHIPPSQDQPP